MRTTIVFDDEMAVRLKRMAPRRRLSKFINNCLWEHFEREEKRRLLTVLEKAYSRAAKARAGAGDFDDINLEDWPEW